MSQPDEPVDPYLPGRHQSPDRYPQGQEPQHQEYQQYPHGFPEPSYTSGGYRGGYQDGATSGWAPGGHGPEAVQRLEAGRPPAVRALLQVMVAGGVVELLTGLLALRSIGTLVEETVVELDRMAAESGMEPIQVSQGLLGSLAAGTVVLFAVLGAGLWLLFAWLFSRGRARVLGTVLGALNGVGSLFGLLGSRSSLDLALSLVYLGLVVAGLVLLWRRETTEWFRALSRARAPWG